jgi:hypothetical protein
MATVITSLGPARLAKKTQYPASPRQQRIVGKLINLLLQHGVYETLEDAQADFIHMTGYDSIKKMSSYNAQDLIKSYADMLRNRIEAKKAEREFFQGLDA